MIHFREAQEIIVNSCPSTHPSEIVALQQAYGRILATNITADRDYPPFNRSAMDGFAIHSAEYKPDYPYRIIATIFAGNNGEPTSLQPGEVYKIMTGAAVPASADAVIKIEDASLDGATVKFHLPSIKPNQNIAKQGEDLTIGETALRKGSKIDFGSTSLLASLGIKDVPVIKPPTIAIITTGNEVKEIEQPVLKNEIRNGNRYTLDYFFKTNGVQFIRYLHIPDSEAHLIEAIEKNLDVDILLCTGGVSTGDADYVPHALKACGVKEVFHKVKIKPGKPFWFGRYHEKTAVFALPGNPLSVQCCVKLFVEPYLLRYYSTKVSDGFLLPMAATRKKKTPLDEFFPVTLIHETITKVSPHRFNGSGDVRALTYAQGLALHAAEVNDLQEGEMVKVYLF